MVRRRVAAGLNESSDILEARAQLLRVLVEPRHPGRPPDIHLFVSHTNALEILTGGEDVHSVSNGLGSEERAQARFFVRGESKVLVKLAIADFEISEESKPGQQT